MSDKVTMVVEHTNGQVDRVPGCDPVKAETSARMFREQPGIKSVHFEAQDGLSGQEGER